MKKLTLLFAAFVIMFGGLFTGCEDAAEAEGPTLSFFAGNQQEFITSDVTVDPGAVLRFSWLAVKGDKNLTSMEVTRDGAYLAGYPDEVIPNDNYRDTLITEAPINNGYYLYAFEVFDRNENSAVKEFTITVSVEAADEHQATLGAQNNAQSGSSFASSNGQVYKLADAAANSDVIDFVYFYGATNAATLSAPDNLTDLNEVFGTGGNAPANWSTNNDTRFATTTKSASAFDDIEASSELIPASEPSDNKANQLAADDVIAFKTAGGKYGLIKVVSIDGASNTGSITIVVKVQP